MECKVNRRLALYGKNNFEASALLCRTVGRNPFEPKQRVYKHIKHKAMKNLKQNNLERNEITSREQAQLRGGAGDQSCGCKCSNVNNGQDRIDNGQSAYDRGVTPSLDGVVFMPPVIIPAPIKGGLK
ncbi:MAG: hypothetical protein NC396_00280 [Bacteroides sp.]|nr:hypothetical protein [Bacteroides sp.]MCM1084756.1 hypothetical protein [Bacteroides sp.]